MYRTNNSYAESFKNTFRIKWKKPRTAWINDLGIFTEILLGKGWHI